MCARMPVCIHVSCVCVNVDLCMFSLSAFV